MSFSNTVNAMSGEFCATPLLSIEIGLRSINVMKVIYWIKCTGKENKNFSFNFQNAWYIHLYTRGTKSKNKLIFGSNTVVYWKINILWKTYFYSHPLWCTFCTHNSLKIVKNLVSIKHILSYSVISRENESLVSWPWISQSSAYFIQRTKKNIMNPFSLSVLKLIGSITLKTHTCSKSIEFWYFYGLLDTRISKLFDHHTIWINTFQFCSENLTFLCTFLTCLRSDRSSNALILTTVNLNWFA